MKISNISNISFQKRAVMTCKIVDKQTGEKVRSKLWKYDLNDSKDTSELVKNPKIPFEIRSDISRVGYHNGYRGSLYVLKKMNSKDVMGCIETTRHFRPKNAQLCGVVTQVDKVNLSNRYVNTLEPMIAQIAKEADEKFDNSIIFAIRHEDIAQAKNMKLSETKNGEPYIPSKRFYSVIDRAQQRSRIEFMS